MRVVIVGGGTAGWMTASYLAKAFGKMVDITLVESASIKTIGVGEATFSTFKLFFDFLGLSESDWMPHCSASFKLAIRFQGWTKAGGHFYHPFERYRSASGITAADWWLKLKRGEQPFDYACFTVPRLCDEMRSPRHRDGRLFDKSVRAYFAEGQERPATMVVENEVQYPYGYHFDAAELAGFLKDYALGRGVRRVTDTVIDVALSEDGSISFVRTAGHGAVEGDLFVDCTGFRGLLINKALGEPFISFRETLMNDSAVAIQAPRTNGGEGLRPYTTAHALSAGWAWNIPLYTRDGTGYVYSSQHIDADGAERELRELLGSRSDGRPANHIKMRVGRTRNSWVKNCVAVGLSSGFVEPLESTGIFFIQHNIEELVSHFPRTTPPDPAMVASFNRNVGRCIDGVREFLAIHYYAGDRDDTEYWRDTRKIALSDSLREQFDIWSARLPGAKNVYESYHGFGSHSWSVMLLGLNRPPASNLPVLDAMSPAPGLALLEGIKADADRLVRDLPSAYEYLTEMRRANQQAPGG